MKTLLNRIPLYWLVTILTGVPIAISLIFLGTYIATLEANQNDASKNSETVQLIVLYDNLAHNLAVERGLTAGVLGSKGKGQQVEALNKQRSVVDEKVANLRQFKSQFVDVNLVSALSEQILSELSKLGEVRRQVDTLKPTISPFAYYSNINQLAIDNSVLLMGTLSEHELAQTTSALVSVIIMKERAGQVRGALNGAFARKQSSLTQYSDINSYLNSGNYALRSAKLAMNRQMSAQLDTILTSATWQQVNSIQQQYLAQKETLDTLTGPSPGEWFPLATEKIKLLNQLRNSLQASILSSVESKLESSAKIEWITVIAAIVIGLVLIVTIGIALSNIRSRVNHLNERIYHMSSQRDLTTDISLQGKDELAKIAASVTDMTANLKKLLSDIVTNNESSYVRLEEIVTGAKDLRSSSETTISHCSSIAASMTQLSQSSTGIAHASENALEETKAMKSQIDDCQAQSKKSFTSMEGLVKQIEQTQSCMQELEKDATSVSQFVETITSISEQTNLLALNAAIEAARAGDHGRGFAVVSTEVRDLAQRSKEATEHISQLLANMSKNTNDAVNNMNLSREATHTTFESVQTVADSISQLERVIEQVNQHINSIASSTEEQSAASAAVDQDVDKLAEIAQHTGTLATTTRDNVSEYQQQVAAVTKQLRQFRLN